MKQYVQAMQFLSSSFSLYFRRMHTPIVIICQNQISARGMREAMLNVLFHLLSQQQTKISCDRYMIVVKETEIEMYVRCPK